MNPDILHIGINGHVVAFSTEAGQEIWRTRLQGGGFFSGTSRQDVCVLEHHGKVFAGCYGYLYCLDAANGQILWWSDLQGLGHNDVSLSIAGKSVQLATTVVHDHS